MKGDTRLWIEYADENLRVAEMAKEQGLYNSCLQNCQQSVEKYLKAMIIERGIHFEKTHSIGQLQDTLLSHSIESGLDEDACELLDSVYLPSKYPVMSVLPDYTPDDAVCSRCIEIARNTKSRVMILLSPR